MELRVWVDGIQRVVCGVKLTTTCQEIVFALAHATQQAGRFTMIERWRNNERLLSPNEQPLVTLQRWGDHMNEVEFILRKTSNDLSINQPINQLQSQQQAPIRSNHISEQNITNQSHSEQTQVSKNYPFEDLYGTINKKRNNHPPAVPAKPRVVGPIAPVANIPMSHQQLQPVNNAQMNFYHPNQSPFNIYPNRPRHPPGYLDYMEALASRNSLTQPILSNLTYAQQTSQHAQSILFQRSFDPQKMYTMQQNDSSPVNTSATSHRYRYFINGHMNRTNYEQNNDMGGTSGIQNVNPIRPKLIDSGIVINRGSAVNVKLPPSSQNLSSQSLITNDCIENLFQNSSDTSSSVSQIGHDMLKVIEEQKKVLINQKNELDRLDNDQEYWETKQNSEQTELINRIENEIHQLEELWKVNQAQIKKLENQDFEKELQELKSEQAKMVLEIDNQKGKLSRCEKNIFVCKNKIEQLEAELADQESDFEDVSSESDTSLNV